MLKGVSFDVAPGERVGVVGRTGAGKSSLLAAILRMAPSSGGLTISGVPACDVDLFTLRCASVVTQRNAGGHS